MEIRELMQEMARRLNEASNIYYNTEKEIMTNREWDQLYDALAELEKKTGIILSDSPTQKVGYQIASSLPKEAHKEPALSLQKTKEIDEFASFLGNRDAVLSWKMDGLTVVLTYENGELIKAVTRGNKFIGEVITENARMFIGLPIKIPEMRPLVVRGEAYITYKDFEAVNAALPEGKEPYQNPRNLCSGSVRQLDPGETKKRHVRFAAFAMSMDNDPHRTRMEQFAYLKDLGFSIVGHTLVMSKEELRAAVRTFESAMKYNEFPSDGLVLQFNDIAYGISLGQTAKYPKDAIAFKWQDDTVETTLRKIHWSPSRTGLINPVAVFDPVELEGTTVTRASVHNVSILNQLSLCPGDTITVYKANMIIPQVAENLTKGGIPRIPDICPACGNKTVIREGQDETKVLYCPNPDCSAKHIKRFVHAVGRDALNIEGLSEETIRKFLEEGFLHTLADLYRLKNHANEIKEMDGFGEKSCEKLLENVEKARDTDLQHLIYALGIENIGHTASKAICEAFQYDMQKTVNATKELLLVIPDIGDVIAASFVNWFKNQWNQEIFEDLYRELHVAKPMLSKKQKSLLGKVFVITGSLNHYPNRESLKAEIESLGGKVSGSVSRNTNYLINNNLASTSGKNKRAKELGIPVISEEEFLSKIMS